MDSCFNTKRALTHAQWPTEFSNASEISSTDREAVKPVDWTMDWTVDWALDWTAWDHQEPAPPAQSSGIGIKTESLLVPFYQSESKFSDVG